MARKVRQKSESGIYHVIVRGINRQNIFHNDYDFQLYLEILESTRKISNFILYGYCLMSNHVHLLIHEKNEDISKIMKRLGTRYAWHYNKNYDRVGHVFQDRFKSENVEDDKYLLGVIRYIHNNPVKAMMVNSAEKYKWSSCKSYFGYIEYPKKLISTEFILELLSKEKDKAIEEFKIFMIKDTSDVFMECKSIARKTDKELSLEIEKILGIDYVSAIQNMTNKEIQVIVRKVKRIEGVTQRQLARVLGIPENLVFKS